MSDGFVVFENLIRRTITDDEQSIGIVGAIQAELNRLKAKQAISVLRPALDRFEKDVRQLGKSFARNEDFEAQRVTLNLISVAREWLDEQEVTHAE